jgi:lysophospholipase-2
MMTAWYTPSPLSPYPSSRPELDDPEDEEGLLRARTYVESLLDDLVSQGIPPNRIVLGGFSQGHAVSLLTGLTSAKYADKLAGLVCLSGYLPLHDRIQLLRSEADLPSTVGLVPMFIVRGQSDILVPKRYLRMQLEKLKELGVADSALEVHEYEGLGHRLSPQELMDLCTWLEKVIPPLA